MVQSVLEDIVKRYGLDFQIITPDNNEESTTTYQSGEVLDVNTDIVIHLLKRLQSLHLDVNIDITIQADSDYVYGVIDGILQDSLNQ